MTSTNISIISAEEFRNRSIQIIPIPGFSPGDNPIYIQIKSTGIMNLLANGRIPNTLLSKVTELFGGSDSLPKDRVPSSMITKEMKESALGVLAKKESGLTDMAELLKVFASATMISPSYEDVKDYMTDEQLMAVFSAMYNEVEQAEKFRDNEGNE